MSTDYQLGVDSAVVLGYGGARQAVIKGLNSLGLPELMREVISISEFRTDFAVEFTGEGKHGRFTFGGNMVLGDTDGQDRLKEYIKNNTKFTDCRFYLDLVNFVAPDLANDPDNAGFQVVKYAPGEGQKNGTYPISGEMVTNGLYCYFVAHLVDDASPTLAFAGDTITDSGNGFVTAGFSVGQTIIVEGATTAGNDGQYLVTAVEAGVLTCTGASFTTEPAIEGTAIHGGKL